jgi:hypothetical protein
MAYTPDEVKLLIDAAETLNEKLKNVVSSMKEVAEAKAFGNMAENLENFGKILNKYDQSVSRQKELNTLINQQSTSLKGQNQTINDYVDAIEDSVKIRRKLGEETNILASYQSKLQDAQISGDQTRINRAQTALDLQYDQVKSLEQQLQSYDRIVGDQNTLKQLVGDVNAEALFQLALTTQQKEIYDDYVRNHKLQVDFLNQALTAEEVIRAKKEAQLKQDEAILKAEEQKLERIKQNVFYINQYSKIQKEVGDILGFQKITLGAVIKGAFDLNKIFVDNAKQLGTTREVTKQIAGDVANQSAKAGTLASYGTQDVQTRKNALEAQAALNKSLGTAAMYSSERLRDQNFLTKIMGLEVEDAVKLQQLSLVSGKTNKEVVDSVNNQVIGLGKQTGIYLDNRKVLADVAKVSGQLASQYKNNPELIAQAVVKVQQLGMNLEQAANSSNKLLNFSDSLAKELEAELLTGKAINLEQARYYALMGDSAKAAEELMANIGGLEEFNKLNVLQQRAYAEAVGMSADELANTLKTQELLKQTGDNSLEALNERRRIAAEEGKSEEFLQELRRAGTSEEMIANQAQLASQDKMNALVEKTLELFSTMVEPMTHLVGKAIDFVDALGGAKALLGIIGGLWVGKIAASIATTGVQLALQTTQLSAQVGIQKILARTAQEKAAAEAIAASASTFGAATPFIIGGAAAIIAGLGIAASFGAFSGGGEEQISEKMSGGRGEAPSRENNNITIQNKFTLNNRDLGYMATSTNVGTQRRFDS